MPRAVEQIVEGHTHGGITRMLTRPALRERLKPFVFLDQIAVPTRNAFGGPYHPHSGVATLTHPRGTRLRCDEVDGSSTQVEPGGLQWMVAGGGTWHRETYQPEEELVSALQVWLLLPDELGSGAVAIDTLAPESLPRCGAASVWIGRLDGVEGAIRTPIDCNLFDLALQGEQGFSFMPPADHDVAWIYCYEGSITVGGEVLSERKLAILDVRPLAIELNASSARCLLGTARHLDAPLSIGRFSMHTSVDALEAGMQRIGELQRDLKKAGRI